MFSVEQEEYFVEEVDEVIITSVEFSYMSTKGIDSDLSRLSVFPVSGIIESSLDLGERTNTLYDLKMGVIESDERCETCGQSDNNCQGHLGHINIYNTPLIIPLKGVTKFIADLLSMFDKIKVEGRVEFTIKASIESNYDNYRHLQGIKRFNALIKLIKNKRYFESNKTQFYKTIKEQFYEGNKKTTTIPIEMESLYNNLSQLPKKWINKIGLENINPENLILFKIPVIPTNKRPYISEGGKDTTEYRHHDFTLVYQKMLKERRKLQSIIEKNNFFTNDDIENLAKALEVLLINKKNYDTQMISRDSRKISASIKSKLDGKEGLRGKALGKRTNQSMRTVVSGDPNIRYNEVGIPIYLSKRTSVGILINTSNVRDARNIYRDGNYTHIIFRNGMVKFNLDDSKKVNLNIGDTIYRYLQNGDYVICNRSPSLHKPSVKAHRVKIFDPSDIENNTGPNKIEDNYTMRFNHAVLEGYNMDFDKKHCRKQVTALQVIENTCRDKRCNLNF